MHISTIEDCYTAFSRDKTHILGIWVTAFMRIMPALLLKEKFSIICYKDSLDLSVLSSYTDIFCIQRQKGWHQIKALNTSGILEHPATKAYWKQYPWAYLFIYKNSKPTTTIANKLWYKILNNASDVRKHFENKKEFRRILEKIGVQPIPWKNIPLRKFIRMEYDELATQFGDRLVIQLPDIKHGGGKGTIFINNKNEFDSFIKKITCSIYKNIKISSVNVTSFIEWTSCSIIGCTTRYGTFSSSIQTQLIDIPEAIQLKKWSWLFCGHDRSAKHFWPKFQEAASKIVQTLGAYMYKQWYKWIFWLDLIIDEQQETIHVVECNSRYTWAFPMISMLDMAKDRIPMDAFHILEHMNIDYTVDFDTVDKQYKYDKEGSHIILCNKEQHEVVCKQDLLPGVYSYTNGSLSYKRPWLGYADIKESDEFIIIDGNPRKWQKIRASNELSRFCHILFPWKISLSPNQLDERTKRIISTIYDTFIW